MHGCFPPVKISVPVLYYRGKLLSKRCRAAAKISHKRAARECGAYPSFPNQVKINRTRPERRLLRALRLILIAILEYCCFVCRPNPSQNALFRGSVQSQAGRSLYCKGEIRTQSKAASGVEALACVLLARAARFVFFELHTLPLLIASHPERAHFAMDWGGEAAIPTEVLQ